MQSPDAHEKFLEITTAYDVLKDEEERANYDYMLDNPDEVYSHYYHYYRRRVAPKVDVRIVIAVTITVISVVQYIGWSHSYNAALSAALRMPHYRTRAKGIARERGLLDRKKKGVLKEDLKAEEEATLRSILEENIDVVGGYSKPQVWDVLWFTIVFSPYWGVMYGIWKAKWVWRYRVKGQDYSEEDREYITRKRLKLSENHWKAMPEEKRSELLERELWVEANFNQYKTEQEDEMKTKLASSGKYKMYRRYMKNNKNRMTFED
ncbi:DnaJ homolog subfamily C member 25 [Geodia barretti]|uniref:DnaJ homolog subfamily C member 25 n=1 Tax=Geodia barretti TaxID=519541 RepID=A0AA35XAU5_GEOBA|nr:DnaJ homolog subfamily C member 25 [Geodia barretti]